MRARADRADLLPAHLQEDVRALAIGQAVDERPAALRGFLHGARIECTEEPVLAPIGMRHHIPRLAYGSGSSSVAARHDDPRIAGIAADGVLALRTGQERDALAVGAFVVAPRERIGADLLLEAMARQARLLGSLRWSCKAHEDARFRRTSHAAGTPKTREPTGVPRRWRRIVLADLWLHDGSSMPRD